MTNMFLHVKTIKLGQRVNVLSRLTLGQKPITKFSN